MMLCVTGIARMLVNYSGLKIPGTDLLRTSFRFVQDAMLLDIKYKINYNKLTRMESGNSFINILWNKMSCSERQIEILREGYVCW